MSSKGVRRSALDLAAEKALHDSVVRRFSGVGSRRAFREDGLRASATGTQGSGTTMPPIPIKRKPTNQAGRHASE